MATAQTQIFIYKNGTTGTTVGGSIIGALAVSNASQSFWLGGQDTIPCLNGLSVSIQGASGPIISAIVYTEP